MKKITWNSPVVLCYLVICLIATILGILTNGASTKLLFSTYRSSWVDPLTYLRLFTHVAGHSGWEHFIGNASFLLLLGPMLEDKYGKRKMIEVILCVALVSGIANNLFFPHTMLSGASGVVFAWILLTSFTSFREGEIPIPVIRVAVIFLGK
ncbi:MAG: rhomboid family intramembrane serine protease, partial [Bacillota bacterium]|nr:rhomboid family intramembrane serine protease [Bacillota bacterium]